MLVLRPGALGDTLLAVPALRALRQAYRPLTLGAHGAAARLLEQVGEVDRGLPFDHPSLTHLFRSTNTASPIQEDTVAWLSGPRPPALADALIVAPGRPPAEASTHCATYLLDTLQPLGIAVECDDRPLALTPLRSDEILIHPGSGAAVKNWPATRFAATIGALDRPVRLIVGEADTAPAQAVEAALGYVLPRLEQLPLDQLAARLAGCHAYLGNDSGVSHLAGLVGVRTIALFGPTAAAVWAPLGPHVRICPFGTEPTDIAALLD